MRLRELLEWEFQVCFVELSREMQICIERIEFLERHSGESGLDAEAEGGGKMQAGDLETRLNTPTENFPIHIGLALSTSQRERVFQLRHDSFVESGWIAPRASGLLHDAFDDLATSILIEAVVDRRAVATMRIAMSCGQSRAAGAAPSLPCEVTFAHEVTEIRARSGPRLAEFSRVAIDPTITNTSFKTTLYGGLVRTAFIVALVADINYAFAAVHRRVASFYRHMVGFESLARSSTFGIIAEPTELLGCAGLQLVRRAAQRSSFFQVQPGEIERAHALLQQHFPALAIPDRPRVQRAQQG